MTGSEEVAGAASGLEKFRRGARVREDIREVDRLSRRRAERFQSIAEAGLAEQLTRSVTFDAEARQRELVARGRSIAPEMAKEGGVAEQRRSA